METATNHSAIDTVIFDIGRVLVDFQPDIPLSGIFPIRRSDGG